MIEKGIHYKLAHLGDNITIKSILIIKKIMSATNSLIRAWQTLFNIEKFSGSFKSAKYLAWPMSYIWGLVYIREKRKKRNSIPILTDQQGFHAVGGNTGEGKSSFVFELAERDRVLLGKPWCMNTEIEKKRFNDDLNAYVKYHRYIPFTSIWSGFKMHMQLNKHLYSAYLIDEMHRVFDYRQNRTTEYMSMFEPFRDYAVVSRKHIGRIFGITQMDRLDTRQPQLSHTASGISALQPSTTIRLRTKPPTTLA